MSILVLPMTYYSTSSGLHQRKRSSHNADESACQLMRQPHFAELDFTLCKEREECIHHIENMSTRLVGPVGTMGQRAEATGRIGVG